MRPALIAFSLLPALAVAQTPAERPFDAVPYEPSLNLADMDPTANPCEDFYKYTCGGWQKRNPIPADQSSWSVYSKLEQENLQFLWGVLEEAAKDKPGRSAVDQQVGNYFASCMDTEAIKKAGLQPLAPLMATVSPASTQSPTPLSSVSLQP